MELHNLIYDFVKQYGADTIRNPQIVGMMMDRLVFRGVENKCYLPLFRKMCKMGVLSQLMDMGQWKDDSIDDLKNQVQTFYQGPADIHYALESIAYALGWKKEIESSMAFNSNQENIEQQVGLTATAVKYIAHGSNKCIGTLIPASMAQPVHNQLNIIANEEGGVADFLMEELNIGSLDELEAKISGEQIDGVAMAIRQMRQGRGFILGDMTGIGKGRQLAMLLQWAVLQGDHPVFVTERSVLFSDLYRDMMDIGCGNLVPFILNKDAEARICDSTGVLVHGLPSPDEIEDFKTTHQLPAGYDFLLLTYSQLSREKDKNWKWEAVLDACKNSFLFLDESHNASGEDSNIGTFFREAVKVSCGVCFASATYAKYPSSMPIYAMKTAMAEANIRSDQLIEIIEHGGPILQEVMAKGLVESGSMIRRQRDMREVERVLHVNEDPIYISENRQRYDKVIELIRDIHDWQERFITPYLGIQDAEAILRTQCKVGKGEKFIARKTHVSYCRFSSRMTPVIRQLLFAIKTEDAIQETLRELKAGRKPIIQLNRTMESNYIGLYNKGELCKSSDFALLLLTCIEGMFHYNVEGVTQTGRKGATRQYRCSVSFDLKDLRAHPGNAEAENGYRFLTAKIRAARTQLPISPLDYFIQRIEKEGYKVGELTHRKLGLRYDVSLSVDAGLVGMPIKRIDKKKVAAAFNDGSIDVLVGNRTMASGISLHSSASFRDQRQRVVITWEQQDSADRQTQFDGRADRTGQMSHCAFRILSSPIPAEKRFLMMQERKLRSLNANVEANQFTSEAMIEDMLNPYGAKVALEYLKENPEKMELFSDILNMDACTSEEKQKFMGEFMRILGLLSCREQEEILTDLLNRYKELIQYLDEVGENELKSQVLPLKARLLKRSVFVNGRKNSNSPFGCDAMLDEVEVDVLRKPLAASQIIHLQGSLNDVDSIITSVENECQNKMCLIESYYQHLKQEAQAQLQATLLPGAAHYTPSRIEQLKERADNDSAKESQLQKVQESSLLLRNLLRSFKPGQPVGIPLSLLPDGAIDDEHMVNYVSVGIFLGFRMVGTKPTRSNIKAVFAVNDSRVRLDIPLTEEGKLQTIQQQTRYGFMYDVLKNVDIQHWDAMTSKTTTEKAYIVTSNLLLGIAAARSFGKKEKNRKLQAIARNKGRGHLIVYTDDMGRIRNGYLMPRMFHPSDVARYVG